MKLITILFSLLLLTATKECGDHHDSNPNDNDAKKEVAMETIINGSYDITMVGSNDYSEHDITMNLEMGKENRISGKSACNQYSGTFENPKENKIEIGMLAGTKMYCRDVAKVESDYLAHLSRVTSVKTNKQGLDLMDKSGEVIIVAMKKEMK